MLILILVNGMNLRKLLTMVQIQTMMNYGLDVIVYKLSLLQINSRPMRNLKQDS